MLREGQFGEWIRATDGLQGQGWRNSGSSSAQNREPEASPIPQQTQEGESGGGDEFSPGVEASSVQLQQNGKKGASSSSKREERENLRKANKDLVVFGDSNQGMCPIIMGEDTYERDIMVEVTNGSTTRIWDKHWVPDFIGKEVELRPEIERGFEWVKDLMTSDGKWWDESKLDGGEVSEARIQLSTCIL
ncbi:armadillo repeat kinesin 2 [Striga asiatica]|uniref:Armadillo repeat kinesin 2 n=1 Tax=Striga asiatica TaxID=4170 RepID=A0A5A7Q7T1_STRAF|nr:armadillo repeat kinesin 2 [Striga asiatica]